MIIFINQHDKVFVFLLEQRDRYISRQMSVFTSVFICDYNGKMSIKQTKV